MPYPITSADVAPTRATAGARPSMTCVSMSPRSDPSTLPLTRSDRPLSPSHTLTVAFGPSRNASCRTPRCSRHRCLCSQGDDEDKSGEYGAENTADGIDGVGCAHILSARHATPGGEIGEQGEGHAHADRGNQDDGAHRHPHQQEAR